MTPIEHGDYWPGMFDSDGRRCTDDEDDAAWGAAWAAIGVFPVLHAHMTIPEIAECLRKQSLVGLFHALGENELWGRGEPVQQKVERVTSAMQAVVKAITQGGI